MILFQMSAFWSKNVVNKIRSKVNNLAFMPSGFDFDDRSGRRLHDSFKTEAIISGDYLILFVVDEKRIKSDYHSFYFFEIKLYEVVKIERSTKTKSPDGNLDFSEKI